MATIALRWTRPTYAGHLYTEIYRSTSQLADTQATTVEAGAVKIAEASANVIFDEGRTPGATYWYYLRHVNTNGEQGAFTEREQAADEIGTADLADDAVTFAKLQNIATARLLGRTNAGAGSVEELAAAAVRTLLNVADGADVSPVASVAGKTGAVTLDTGDVSGLGTMATQNATAVSITGGDIGEVTLQPGSSRTPANNGDLVIEATDNTTLTFKLKGSDGTVRSGTVALT